MKKYFTLVIVCLIAACSSPFVSKNETKAVDKVLEFYGGICNRSKGFNTSDKSNETYFELELSQSKLIETYSTMLQMPASNIAYLFYTNLGTDKNKYTQIRVNIMLDNKEVHKYSYSTKALNEINSLMPNLERINSNIKNYKYNLVLNEFEQEVKNNIDTTELDDYCNRADSAFGLIKSVQFQGYSLIKNEDKEYVQLYSIQIREKENIPFCLLLDRKTKKMINFKYSF